MSGSVLLGIHGAACYGKVETDRVMAARGGPIFGNTNSLENGDVSFYALMWSGNCGEVVTSPLTRWRLRLAMSSGACALEIKC